jgi:hypothetical protein
MALNVYWRQCNESKRRYYQVRIMIFNTDWFYCNLELCQYQQAKRKGIKIDLFIGFSWVRSFLLEFLHTNYLGSNIYFYFVNISSILSAFIMNYFKPRKRQIAAVEIWHFVKVHRFVYFYSLISQRMRWCEMPGKL